MDQFINGHPWLTFFMFLSVTYTVRVLLRGYPRTTVETGDSDE